MSARSVGGVFRAEETIRMTPGAGSLEVRQGAGVRPSRQNTTCCGLGQGAVAQNLHDAVGLHAMNDSARLCAIRWTTRV